MIRPRHITWYLLGTAIVLALVISWPLPRFAASGIPYAARNPEQPPARYDIAGDHLQLMYHFDLVREMITGRIPWFHNPYEFNWEGDTQTFRPDAYFLPYSGIYALLSIPLGQAVAYNLTWLLSVWLTALFAWAWLARFTTDRIAIAMGVLMILLLPFRWLSIFGGSPAGIALCWVPLLAWQVDKAVHEARWQSGAGVGLALLLALWGDLHVFYFSALALPGFVLLSVLSPRTLNHGLPWRRWPRVLPAGLTMLGVLVSYYLWRRHMLVESMMRGGRTWEEVAAFSPARIGLLGGGRGIDDTVFIGLTAMLVMALLSLYLLYNLIHKKPDRAAWFRLLTLLLLGGAIALTVALALGIHGPFQARFLGMARAKLPYYEMLRQPSKIYAIMPMWVGLLMTLGWAALAVPPRWKRGLAVAVALVMTVEMHFYFGVTTNLLSGPQPAYTAVQQDALARGHDPVRALVVPLWPGESSETSVPLFHAQRLGIRLVNGYSPVVSRRYFEEVFRRLESVNQGEVNNEQIGFLLAREVHYLLLHENQFPERVSPSPVALTRDRLLAHPRLELLKQAEHVWAFRLLPTAREGAEPLRDVVRFPTRRWSFAGRADPAHRTADPAAHGGHYLHLAPDSPAALSPVWRIAPGSSPYWLIRLRGHGTAQVTTRWGDKLLAQEEEVFSLDDWEWVQIPLPALPGYGPIQLVIDTTVGRLDLDFGLLAKGDWPGLEPDFGVMELLAADFFRAGYSRVTDNTVVLRPGYEVADAIFYGPRLPLAAGHYAATLHLDTAAPPGTLLGEWSLRAPMLDTPVRVPVFAAADDPATITWHHPHDFVVEFAFTNNRAAPLTLRKVVIEQAPSLSLSNPSTLP